MLQPLNQTSLVSNFNLPLFAKGEPNHPHGLAIMVSTTSSMLSPSFSALILASRHLYLLVDRHQSQRCDGCDWNCRYSSQMQSPCAACQFDLKKNVCS
jgi:hypothetical protein